MLVNGYWEAFYVWSSGVPGQCALGTATLADPDWYREYPCPEPVGQLRITGIDETGMVIAFTSASGVTGRFSLQTQTWAFDTR